MPLPILADVLEDLLATEDLDLLEGHVAVEVVVEGSRDHAPAQIPDPLLDGILVMDLVGSALEGSLYRPIPVLEFDCSLSLLIIGNVDGVFQELLHLLQYLSCLVGTPDISGRQELILVTLS